VHVLAPSIGDVGVVDRSSVVGVRRRTQTEESRSTSVGAHAGCPVAGVGGRSTDRRGRRPRHGPGLDHAGPWVMRRAPSGRRKRS
jgi:hypothetical protein